MPRVHHVKKARKANPVANVGESYYWWQNYKGPKQYSTTYPRQSQLTGSDKLARLYSVGERLEDVASDTSLVSRDEHADYVRELADEVREVAEEYRESASNMEEYFPGSERAYELEEKADACDSYADEIDAVADEIESLPDEDDLREEMEDDRDEDDDIPTDTEVENEMQSRINEVISNNEPSLDL